MKRVEGGVTAPLGFRASGVHAGIKHRSKRKDCALVASDTAAALAGMFTTNILKSPPVRWNMGICEKGAARTVFINSGNANAATGDRGHRDVAATAEELAKALSVRSDEVAICSTGVIGVPLPMDKIKEGIAGCVGALSREGGLDAAHAIMTTDKVAKEAAVEVPLKDGTVRIGAISKGSGMLHPNMATMICILTTDADISVENLRKLLHEAVDVSFHQISVDNDMSTSDTVLIFANGESGQEISPYSEDYLAFGQALTEFCQMVAKDLVRDGEGATKFVEIAVSGAPSDGDAKRVARAIGNSQLCKTAFFGEDPNWGRFACAAGYAGVNFDPAELAIWLNDIQLVDKGIAADYEEKDAAKVMKKPEFQLRVSIGSGNGEAVFWTSDLSHEYVSINADYRS